VERWFSCKSAEFYKDIIKGLLQFEKFIAVQGDFVAKQESE